MSVDPEVLKEYLPLSLVSRTLHIDTVHLDTCFSGLNSGLLGTQAEGRILALEEKTREYGTKRGQLLAGIKSSPEKIQALDKTFFDDMKHFDALFRERPELVSRLCLFSKQTQDVSRLETLEANLVTLGHQIGASYSRKPNESLVAEARLSLFNYLGPQEDILHKCPGLHEKVKSIVDEAEHAGIDMRAQAEEYAIQIYRALNGRLNRLTHKGKVIEILLSATPQMREIVDRAHLERYGKQLEDVIRKFFKGVKQDLALSLLKGDDIASGAGEICLALNSSKAKGFLALRQILSQTPKDKMGSISTYFNAKYANQFNHASLKEIIHSRFRGHAREILLSLLDRDQNKADAHFIRWLIIHRKLELFEICNLLESKSEKEREALKVSFMAEFKIDLTQYLKTYLPQGSEKDRALSLLNNDTEKWKAACLLCAFNKIGDSSIAEFFFNKSQKEREDQVKNYEKVYKSDFWADLEEALRPRFSMLVGRHNFSVVKCIIETGTVSKAQLLWGFMEGLGTNEDGIRSVLANMAKPDIEELMIDYSNRYKHKNGSPRKLVRDLKAELSGDSRFEVLELINGKLETPDERQAALEKRYNHEKSGKILGFIFKPRVRFMQMDNRIAQNDMKLAKRQLEEKISNSMGTTTDLLQHYLLSRLATVGLMSLRSVKLKLANIFTTVAAGGSAVVGFNLIHHASNSLWVSLPATMALVGLFRFITNMGFRGSAYGREEIVKDAVLAVIDGGSFWVRRIVNGALAFRAIRISAKTGLASVVNAMDYVNHLQNSTHLFDADTLDALCNGGAAKANKAPCLNGFALGLSNSSALCSVSDAGIERGWASIS